MRLFPYRLSPKKNVCKSFFVSTPIFYVNSSPHLGHLYTAVIADAAQYFQKLIGATTTMLSTGTDEHGLKVQQAAIHANVTPLKFCDDVSQRFKNVFDKYSIQYSDYIRTSEGRHKDAVNTFFKAIESGGYIYKNKYEGWYCVSDETFLTEKQVEKDVLKTNGEASFVSKESGHPVEWSSETNYLFKLSSFQDDLLYWLKKEDRVVPSRFQEELKLWISNGLYDLSISRPRSRVSWGIPVPNDNEHTMYVWLDALANYLTVAGYPNNKHWPPNLQVIGKDIMRFHGIYWPALLMAANLEPPEKLLVHSHWKVDGVKMSKSLGNIVCPLQLLNQFSPEAVRYVLLRSSTFHSDGSWSDLHAVKCVNADLANTLGNLLSRCVAPSLNPKQTIPSLDASFLSTASPTCKSLLDQIQNLHDEVGEHFANYKYNVGIDAIMNMARTANLFFEEEKPWELKENPDRSKLESILFIGMVAIRAAAISLQPIVPQYTDGILNTLNIPRHERMWHHLKTNINSVFNSPTLGERAIPFRRIQI